MSSFVDEGGKQIFYHGAADPWFSVNETIRYYEEMAAFNGGLETVKDWSRYFHVPGMGHCRGGEDTLDAFDMLTAIVDWVENDTPPETNHRYRCQHARSLTSIVPLADLPPLRWQR